MVDVEYIPFRKVIFRSTMKFDSPLELATNIAKSTSKTETNIRLLWARGVVFRVARGYPSETVVNREIEGILELSHVEFAPMEEYQEFLSIPEKSGFKISIANLSSHSTFGPLAQYIHNNLL